MNKKDYNSIRIPEEIKLSQSLFEALQGEAILQLAKEAQHTVLYNDKEILEQIEQDCFRVEADTSPRYHKLFNEAVQRIGYDEPLNFYIKASAEPNAMAVLSRGKSPHAVVVNSATLQIMHDDEVKQIIGHEIGHLVIRQGELFPILNTLTEQIKQNPSLGYKVRLWQQLSELTADRFGFMAVPDLTVRISSSIKFSSGLPAEQLIDDYNIDYSMYIQRAKVFVEQFKNNYGVSTEAHPIEPIRLAALEIFSQSHWGKENGFSDEELATQTSDLLQALYNVAENELEVAQANFYASAGLIVAGSDAKVNADELEHIYQSIAPYHIFPKAFLKSVSEKDFVSIFENAVNQIIATDPDNSEIREELLTQLIQIAFADQNMRKKEVGIILQIAEQLLGFSRKQAAKIFLTIVHSHFMPNPEDVF